MNKVDYRKETSDVVYFNASYINDTDIIRPANFDQTRGQNIVDKANDYYMSVIRFEVPHSVIAIFDFRQDEYFVTIDNGTNPPPVKLVYQSRGDIFVPNSKFQGIYYFQQFLDIINTGLLTAHNNLGLVTNPPMLVLDENDKFSLIVDENYTEDIIFNTALYRFFLGIDAFFTRVKNKEYRFIYKQIFNNIQPYPAPFVGNYFKMEQENKSQFNWSNITGIVIQSRTIPTTKEYIGLNNQNQTTETQVISDYIPMQTEFTSYDRSPWIYYSQGSERLVDLTSDSPIRSIDFQIGLVTRESNIIPLDVGPGEVVSVKFMFIKKSLKNNEYGNSYGEFHYDDKLKRVNATGLRHNLQYKK